MPRDPSLLRSLLVRVLPAVAGGLSLVALAGCPNVPSSTSQEAGAGAPEPEASGPIGSAPAIAGSTSPGETPAGPPVDPHEDTPDPAPSDVVDAAGAADATGPLDAGAHDLASTEAGGGAGAPDEGDAVTAPPDGEDATGDAGAGSDSGPSPETAAPDPGPDAGADLPPAPTTCHEAVDLGLAAGDATCAAWLDGAGSTVDLAALAALADLSWEDLPPAACSLESWLDSGETKPPACPGFEEVVAGLLVDAWYAGTTNGCEEVGTDWKEACLQGRSLALGRCAALLPWTEPSVLSCEAAGGALQTTYGKGRALGMKAFETALESWLAAEGFAAGWPEVLESASDLGGGPELLDSIAQVALEEIDALLAAEPFCPAFQPETGDDDAVVDVASAWYVAGALRGLEVAWSLALARAGGAVACAGPPPEPEPGPDPEPPPAMPSPDPALLQEACETSMEITEDAVAIALSNAWILNDYSGSCPFGFTVTSLPPAPKSCNSSGFSSSSDFGAELDVALAMAEAESIAEMSVWTAELDLEGDASAAVLGAAAACSDVCIEMLGFDLHVELVLDLWDAVDAAWYSGYLAGAGEFAWSATVEFAVSDIPAAWPGAGTDAPCQDVVHALAAARIDALGDAATLASDAICKPWGPSKEAQQFLAEIEAAWLEGVLEGIEAEHLFASLGLAPPWKEGCLVSP